MTIYGPEDILPVEIEQLVYAAKAASEKAYAPYSKYKVGAAIRDAEGKIYSGSNQENASYPLCMCAERVVLYHYISLKEKLPIQGIGVFAHSSKESPDLPPSSCGACRQVMAEYQSRQDETFFIVLSNQNGHVWYFESISELLPYAFDPKNLTL